MSLQIIVKESIHDSNLAFQAKAQREGPQRYFEIRHCIQIANETSVSLHVTHGADKVKVQTFCAATKIAIKSKTLQ
jgi:hypothetical protein